MSYRRAVDAAAAAPFCCCLSIYEQRHGAAPNQLPAPHGGGRQHNVANDSGCPFVNCSHVGFAAKHVAVNLATSMEVPMHVAVALPVAVPVSAPLTVAVVLLFAMRRRLLRKFARNWHTDTTLSTPETTSHLRLNPHPHPRTRPRPRPCPCPVNWVKRAVRGAE